MRLLRLRSAWGLSGLKSSPDIRRTLAGLRSDGWDGLEASLEDIGDTFEQRRACCVAAQAEGMTLILSAYSSWANYSGPFEWLSRARHTGTLLSDVHQIAELSVSATAGGGLTSPIARINAHSGSDAWAEDEAVEFFEDVGDAIRSIGGDAPPVSHETHRGRYLCCPFVTARMLDRVPTLRLTSDFSHWVVKAERLLDSPEEVALLDTLAPAVDHIHARIGTPQAPQVADVSHASVRAAAERHYAWWESVWSAREAASISGRGRLQTATLEYGPPEVDEYGEYTPGHLEGREYGEYVGYTPADLEGREVAGEPLEATLRKARAALDERWERWHEGGARRTGGW